MSPRRLVLALAVAATLGRSVAYAAPPPPPPPPPSPGDVLKGARWLALAAEAAEAGDDEAHLTYLGFAAKELPGDVDVLFEYGRHLSYAGAHDNAVTTLRRAQTLAPKYRDVGLHLARVLAWAGRYREAGAEVDRLVDDYPAWVEAHTVRGDIWLWSGEAERAEDAFRRALELAPGDRAIEDRLLNSLLDQGDARGVVLFIDSLSEEELDGRRRRLRQRYRSLESRVRVDAALSHTFTEPGDWNAFSGAFGYRVSRALTLGARVDVEHRSYGDFQPIDTSLALPSWLTLGDGFVVRATGMYTARADFAPRGQLTLGFAHELLPLFSYGLDYRYSRYTDTWTHTLFPSVSVSLRRFGFEPTLIITFPEDGDTELTGRLKLLYNITDYGRVELWGHLGTEPLEPTLSVRYDEPVQAGVLFAVQSLIRPMTGLRFSYSLTGPIGPADEAGLLTGRSFVQPRHTLGLAWFYRFGRWQRSTVEQRG